MADNFVIRLLNKLHTCGTDVHKTYNGIFYETLLGLIYPANQSVSLVIRWS